MILVMILLKSIKVVPERLTPQCVNMNPWGISLSGNNFILAHFSLPFHLKPCLKPNIGGDFRYFNRNKSQNPHQYKLKKKKKANEKV